MDWYLILPTVLVVMVVALWVRLENVIHNRFERLRRDITSSINTNTNFLINSGSADRSLEALQRKVTTERLTSLLSQRADEIKELQEACKAVSCCKRVTCSCKRVTCCRNLGRGFDDTKS